MSQNGFIVVNRQLKPANGRLRVTRLRLSFSSDRRLSINLPLLDTVLPWTDWVEMDSIPSEGKLVQVIEAGDSNFEDLFSSCQDLNLAWREVREQFLAIVNRQAGQSAAP